MNDEQEEAAQAILSAIEEQRCEPIVINGMPGSGKTIIAIYMFKFLRDKFLQEEANNKRKQIKIKTPEMALVIPQSSLRKTLKQLFRNILGLKAADVISPNEVVNKNYDIVFVDEAHRLRQRKNIVNFKTHDESNQKLELPKDATELDWILKRVPCPILFFDRDQVIGPSGIGEELFGEKISKYVDRKIRSFTLKSQMRVAAGAAYLDYIKDLLDGQCTKRIEADNYEFKLVEDFDHFHELMHKKEAQAGLTRMLAGYAWPWKSKKKKAKSKKSGAQGTVSNKASVAGNESTFDIELGSHAYRWNSKTEDWVNSKTALEEVGSIHCIQGYDLNYGFVIMGPDIKYDAENHRIYADKNNYFDINGKKTATDEELTAYVKNIYYVLMSRGIKGTYLYVCDEALREYLKQYVDIVESPEPGESE